MALLGASAALNMVFLKSILGRLKQLGDRTHDHGTKITTALADIEWLKGYPGVDRRHLPRHNPYLEDREDP